VRWPLAAAASGEASEFCVALVVVVELLDDGEEEAVACDCCGVTVFTSA